MTQRRALTFVHLLTMAASLKEQNERLIHQFAAAQAVIDMSEVHGVSDALRQRVDYLAEALRSAERALCFDEDDE